MQHHRPLPWLLTALLLAACNSAPLLIRHDQICTKEGSAQQTCLPLDNRNAAIIAYQDGKPALFPLHAQDLVEADSMGFQSIIPVLLENDLALRYHPDSVKFDFHKNGLTIRNAYTQDPPLLFLSKAKLDSVVLIVQRQGEMQILAIANTKANEPKDVTEAIFRDVTSQKSYLSATCSSYLSLPRDGGVGMIVILDEGTFEINRVLHFTREALLIKKFLADFSYLGFAAENLAGLEFQGLDAPQDGSEWPPKIPLKAILDEGRIGCDFYCRRRTVATIPMSGTRIILKYSFWSGHWGDTYHIVQGTDTIYRINHASLCQDIRFSPSNSASCFDITVCEDCRTYNTLPVNHCWYIPDLRSVEFPIR